MSKANRARKGARELNLVLEFEEQISVDLLYSYRGLIYLLDVLSGVHPDQDLMEKVNDPEWIATFHRVAAGYLNDLNGIAGKW